MTDVANQSAILNSAAYTVAPFDITTNTNLGSDKRTRLMIFAMGISGVAANTDLSNDLHTPGGVVANVAESVIVEAHTTDGRTLRLPVEYAGAQGQVNGLDQVNVVLTTELRGAGTVNLTIVVGNLRSNSVSTTIR